MRKKLAIKGHSTRGNEVIELLEMLGGENSLIISGCNLSGYEPFNLYYINDNGVINYKHHSLNKDMIVFTLEEFLEKYPFKVGDVIRFPNDIVDIVEEIAEMEWDEDSEDILCTSASGWKRFLRAHLENPKNNKQKETIMKYKVGNKVRIKSIDWYNENKDKNGIVNLIMLSKGTFNFIKPMARLCGKVVTIMRVNSNFYDILEDVDYCWTDEMIEGLVEEKFITTDGLQLNKSNISLEKEMEWNLPQGYQFKDENGNVINATKIVLEKIKKEYPKTYKECLAILNYNIGRVSGYKASLLAKLQDLLVCRDAYWKIAGEELGLGKSWKPDWTNLDQEKCCIWVDIGEFITMINVRGQHILAFPTVEMRDAFYENFKDLIELCKELL